MTDFKGPMETTLVWPTLSFTPDAHFWSVRQDGRPATAYTLRGCYRPHSIVGLQVDEWGLYPVMCLLSGDIEGEWLVGESGAKRFAAYSDYGSWRGLYLFGYASNGAWVYLGRHKDPTLPLTGLSDATKDRAFMAAAHSVAVWDAEWVEKTYGITMRALPQDWQSLGTDNKKSIMDSLAASFHKMRSP